MSREQLQYLQGYNPKKFYYKFYYFSRFCYILWCYSIKVFPLVWHERVQQKMGTTTFIWQIVTWILGNSNVYLLFSSPPHCALSLPEWSCLLSVKFRFCWKSQLFRILEELCLPPDGRLQSLAAGQSQSRRAESAACNESKTLTGSLSPGDCLARFIFMKFNLYSQVIISWPKLAIFNVLTLGKV